MRRTPARPEGLRSVLCPGVRRRVEPRRQDQRRERRRPAKVGACRGVEVTTATGASRHLARRRGRAISRSEEHTSELQSRFDLVCRLLLEKKKKGARRDLL